MLQYSARNFIPLLWQSSIFRVGWRLGGGGSEARLMAVVRPTVRPCSFPEMGGGCGLEEEWRMLREKARLVLRSRNVRGCVGRLKELKERMRSDLEGIFQKREVDSECSNPDWVSVDSDRGGVKRRARLMVEGEICGMGDPPPPVQVPMANQAPSVAATKKLVRDDQEQGVARRLRTPNAVTAAPLAPPPLKRKGKTVITGVEQVAVKETNLGSIGSTELMDEYLCDLICVFDNPLFVFDPGVCSEAVLVRLRAA